MSYAEALAFQPWAHGPLRLRNRIVMAPMTRRMAAEDGIPTPEIVAYYARRARHGVGLILSEGTGIDSLHAYDTLTVPRFETPEQLAGWRRVVEAVHAEGGAFAPQLWHTGIRAADPIGPCDYQPSPGPDGSPRPAVRGMEAADFAQVLEAYARAAAAAVEIGCDALEIHGAHGYLLDSFLSPKHNRREDEYGGDAAGRMRFPLEVVRVVREAAGPEMPILYRFSQWRMEDYGERKWAEPEDLRTWVLALREAGVDILHASTREATAPGFDQHGETSLAGWARTHADLPVVAVGKVSVTVPFFGDSEGPRVEDPGPALALLERGEADLLAVGRALIANPDWVEIVRDGDWRDLRPYDREMLATLD